MGKLVFAKHYDPEKYPKYDEIDAINVDKISEIPDYPGVMGVPITIFDDLPINMEILGMGRFHINGKVKYCRILVRYKDE